MRRVVGVLFVLLSLFVLPPLFVAAESIYAQDLGPPASSGQAGGFGLQQNYPNPFNPDTQIPYQLPESGEIFLAIYNLLGQQVAVLIQGAHEAGFYRAVWDGRDAYGRSVSSGIYLVRMVTGDFSNVKKMVLLK